ncbi:hypothetical protein [Kitasatospora sp. NPDC056531]|uniref:hypothetical protein n=1 Tax=Kitasatospora sp. NPDC056531 TaxID=3345856 RepID=UPI0036A6CF36
MDSLASCHACQRALGISHLPGFCRLCRDHLLSADLGGLVSRINCPQCGALDQVRSVPSVYQSQSSRYSGTSTGYSSGVAYASGVGVVPAYGRSTVHTSGVSSSLLAVQIAPPPRPRLAKPGLGCEIASLFFLASVFLLFVLPPVLTSDKPHVRGFLLAFGMLGGPFVVAGVALSVRRARKADRFRRQFEEYSEIQPSLAAAWSATFLCLRCNVAYLPDGEFGISPAPVVPVCDLHGLVAVTAARLRDED